MEGNEALKLEQTRLPLEHWDGADDTARIRVRSWDNLGVWSSTGWPQPTQRLCSSCMCLSQWATNSEPLRMAPWI